VAGALSLTGAHPAAAVVDAMRFTAALGTLQIAAASFFPVRHFELMAALVAFKLPHGYSSLYLISFRLT
jgi:hypothetical protein